MTKYLLAIHFRTIFLALLIPSFISSQPNISSSVTPDTGASSTFRTYNAKDHEPGQAGSSQVWDFSTIAPNGTVIFDYQDPANLSGSGQFTGTNLAVDQGGDPQIFFIANTQKLSQVGTFYNGLTENYSQDPKDLLRFPMTFASTFTDTFAGTAIASGLNATRTGITITEADGYGQLILPYATFNNVLRVISISTYEDKLLGNVVNSGTDTVITWYAEGLKDNIMTWSRITSNIYGSVFYGAFQDTMFVSVDPSSRIQTDLEIYPNPASKEVRIDLGNSHPLPFKVNFFDLSGRLLKESLGESSVLVDVTDLETGLYIVRIIQGEAVQTRQIVIER